MDATWLSPKVPDRPDQGRGMRHQYAVIAARDDTVHTRTPIFWGEIRRASRLLLRCRSQGRSECECHVTECRLKIVQAEMPESHTEHARFITEPRAVPDPHAVCCQRWEEGLHRTLVETRGCEPNTTQRSRIGPNPLEKLPVFQHPGRRFLQARREAVPSVAKDCIAPL